MPLGIRSLLGPITDLKSEGQILIITDTDKFQIGKELFDWASKVNETSMAVMTPRASHGDEPTVEIAAAMETANVILRPHPCPCSIPRQDAGWYKTVTAGM